MVRLLFLTSLVLLSLGSGRDPKLDRVTRSSFTPYPSCFIGGSNEDEAKVTVSEEGVGGCIVTNNDKTKGKLVRVMCGGWAGNPDSERDSTKGDFDYMTYQYIPPSRKALLLDGKCNSGHRCRLCGATDAPASGSQSQHFLEHQDYECRRRCQVVLYKHEDFNGEAQTFSHNAPDLKKSYLAGKISSLKVLGEKCTVALFTGTYYKDAQNANNRQAACQFTTDAGEAELAIDMAELNDKCKCNDCITSMSIRESKTCSPASKGGLPVCRKCTSDTDTNCCLKEKSHSVTAERTESLQRLFKAMAAVLED